MKQVTKETKSANVTSHEAAPVKETPKANKSDDAKLSSIAKTKLFNRFLEASCDCV